MNEKQKELKDMVKKGSVTAAYSLAEALKWGYYGGADYKASAAMYRICCRAKDKKMASEGYYNLGILYYYGYLLGEEQREKSRRIAYSCFLKSAMLSHHIGALNKLGDMYRYGQYVNKDERVALSLYVRATGQG